MKNPYQLLHEKEAQVLQLKTEIAALKVAIPLLAEESDTKASREEKKFP